MRRNGLFKVSELEEAGLGYKAKSQSHSQIHTLSGGPKWTQLKNDKFYFAFCAVPWKINQRRQERSRQNWLNTFGAMFSLLCSPSKLMRLYILSQKVWKSQMVSSDWQPLQLHSESWKGFQKEDGSRVMENVMGPCPCVEWGARSPSHNEIHILEVSVWWPWGGRSCSEDIKPHTLGDCLEIRCSNRSKREQGAQPHRGSNLWGWGTDREMRDVVDAASVRPADQRL